MNTYEFLAQEAELNANGYEETARKWDRWQATNKDPQAAHEERINARRNWKRSRLARERADYYRQLNARLIQTYGRAD